MTFMKILLAFHQHQAQTGALNIVENGMVLGKVRNPLIFANLRK